jgi:DNA polymerase III subunit gamma/tau
VTLMQVSDSARARYLQQSELTSISFLLSALNICNQCDINYKSSRNQRLHVELALMKLSKLPQAISLAALAQEDSKKKA